MQPSLISWPLCVRLMKDLLFKVLYKITCNSCQANPKFVLFTLLNLYLTFNILIQSVSFPSIYYTPAGHCTLYLDHVSCEVNRSEESGRSLIRAEQEAEPGKRAPLTEGGSSLLVSKAENRSSRSPWTFNHLQTSTAKYLNRVESEGQPALCRCGLQIMQQIMFSVCRLPDETAVQHLCKHQCAGHTFCGVISTVSFCMPAVAVTDRQNALTVNKAAKHSLQQTFSKHFICGETKFPVFYNFQFSHNQIHIYGDFWQNFCDLVLKSLGL